MELKEFYSEKGFLSEDELYEMANLASSETGLPVYVFLSSKGNINHSARIKVCNTKGKMNVDDVFSIRLHDLSIDGKCKLKADDLEDVKDWIQLNKKMINDYWNNNITTSQMVAAILKI